MDGALNRQEYDLLSPAADKDALLNYTANLSAEEIKEFVHARLASLEASTKPKTISASNVRHEGFLHPASNIKRVIFLNSFHVDDPEIYELLIKNLQDLKSRPGWQPYPLSQIFPYALQHTLGQYFGNYYGTTHTEMRNRAFYYEYSNADLDEEGFPKDSAISIKEMKDKGIAVCAEKSATAQNLLSFFGYSTHLVLGECKFPGSDEQAGHLYNILQFSKDYFIFDPTNPEITHDASGNVIHCRPAVYPITHENFSQLMNGGNVKVIHKDSRLDDAGQTIPVSMEMLYEGPKS